MIPTFRQSANLVDARLQAHWATQVVSALGATLLPRERDYAETNLGWDRERQALVGQKVRGVQAGLRVADLTWFVIGPNPSERSAIGATLAEGLVWMQSAAAENGLDHRPLARSPYGLPHHALARTARFEAVAGLDEIAAWFDVASLAIGRTAERERGSVVRCWPHHFDLATLIEVRGDRTVGVGLSPGDEGIPEPYFYVSPTPRPAPGEGPVRLPVGSWNKRGWFGAVLCGTEIPATDPRATVDSFLDAAVAACVGMVR